MLFTMDYSLHNTVSWKLRYSNYAFDMISFGNKSLNLVDVYFSVDLNFSRSNICIVLLYRKLADKVAAAGFLVVAPDFFYGDPVDLSNPQFDRDAWRKVHNTVSFLLH